MAKILCVSNQKGGVGKTTTSAALAAGIAAKGLRVLGVDLDPQGNLGFCLGVETANGPTVLDALKGTLPVQEAICRTEYTDRGHHPQQRGGADVLRSRGMHTEKNAGAGDGAIRLHHHRHTAGP